VQPQPVAASVAVAPVLAGPCRAVEVVAVTAGAVHLATGDADHPALCLARPGAVRLPYALILGRSTGRAHRPAPGPTLGPTLGRAPSTPTAQSTAWAVGAAGHVGHGRLSLGSLTWRVARWWRPPRPHLARLGSAAARLPDLVPDPLDAGGRAAVRELVAALRVPDADAAGPAASLLGRGPGLTPVGDDVLAGALVTLRALASPAADRLAEVLTSRPGIGDRTTLVSAAILRHAARGECVPELAGVVTALGSDETAGLYRAWARLRRIGHSSGAGLAQGVLAALAATGLPAEPATALAPAIEPATAEPATAEPAPAAASPAVR
jgi:hypothetical protein